MQDNTQQLIALTNSELVKIATKKAGRDRLIALSILCNRTGAYTLKGVLLVLDLVEPKVR